MATSALVFLVCSITGNWKQPLGYVLVDGACHKDEAERLMKEAIDKLDAIGLKVLVIMSDMGPKFSKLPFFRWQSALCLREKCCSDSIFASMAFD